MRHAALTVSVRLIIIAIGLLSSIATARYLGPEGRGNFFFWTTVATVVVQFGNFGLHSSNMYLHARKGIDYSVLNSNSLLASIVAGSVLTVFSTYALYLSGYLSPFDPAIMVSILLLSVSGIYILLGTNLMVAMGEITEFNIVELSIRVFGFSTLFIGLLIYADSVILLFMTGVASAISAGFLFWRLYAKAAGVYPSWQVFRGGISYGIRAYMVACAAAAVAKLNAFMLQPAVPAADYGAWSIASQVLDMMLIVPQSIALVLLPRIMRSENPSAMMEKNIITTLFIMIAIIAVFLVIGERFVSLLYGADFSAAYRYIIWGLPGMLSLSVISILSQYMAVIGIPFVLILIWVFIIFVHGLIAYYLIPLHAVTGGMASQSVSYMLALALVSLLYKILNRKDKDCPNGY